MHANSAILWASLASCLAFAGAAHGDEPERIPGRDNPVLKTILAPDLRIVGKWKGVVRRGHEEHYLTIERDPDQNGSYRLKFYTWTESAGPKTAKRTGTLADGTITLNDSIPGFGVSKTPFRVLYTVQHDGKEFLLPAVNAEELKSADELNPRIAYFLQARTEK